MANNSTTITTNVTAAELVAFEKRVAIDKKPLSTEEAARVLILIRALQSRNGRLKTKNEQILKIFHNAMNDAARRMMQEGLLMMRPAPVPESPAPDPPTEVPTVQTPTA